MLDLVGFGNKKPETSRKATIGNDVPASACNRHARGFMVPAVIPSRTLSTTIPQSAGSVCRDADRKLVRIAHFDILLLVVVLKSRGRRISKTGNRAPAQSCRVCMAFLPESCTFMLSEIVLPCTWLGATGVTNISASRSLVPAPLPFGCDSCSHHSALRMLTANRASSTVFSHCGLKGRSWEPLRLQDLDR